MIIGGGKFSAVAF